MALEVGAVLEGKVTGITKFGAFVELPEGKTGMVHISEVAPTFVKEIKDHITEGQTVKVKVLSIGDDGKISLSIKKAMAPPPQQSRPFNNNAGGAPRTYNNNGGQRPGGGQRPFNGGSQQRFSGNGGGWQKSSEPASFEDMLSKFKQTSDEKMSDLKKVTEAKRGGFSRRGNGGMK